jgi:hypothetical protein
MSLGFLSCFNLFSLSSLKGLDWFEGVKRIKIFLQWLWGVPAGFGAVGFLVYNLLNGSLNYKGFFLWMLFLGIAILLPIIGCELLFRAVVWILGGFLQDGNVNSQVVMTAKAKSHEQNGEKLIKQPKHWICRLKEIKPHHVYWATFIPLWFYIWCVLVTRTGFSPISHWHESGFKFPPVNLTFLEDLRLCWYVFVTIMRGLLAFLVLLFGYHVYQSIEENILLRQDQKKTN